MTAPELVAEINRPLPVALRTRYTTLLEKRHAETLTPEEYEELQELTDQVEADQLRRWENVTKLAELRGEPPLQTASNFGLTLNR